MKTFFLAGANILVFVSLVISVACAQPGTLDITFNPGTVVGQYPRCMALQTNGQILVGGSFLTVNELTYIGIVRLNADGSVDTSFNNVGQGMSVVTCVSFQPDGKVVVGGDRVSRLRTDGSFDVDFHAATSAFTAVNAVAIQGDGKILIAGQISRNTGIKAPVARLNADGSFDDGFNWGSFKNQASDIALVPNGQILVAVPVITVNGISRTNLARLNSNGTIDTTFNADSMDGRPSCVLALTNGQVLIGGSFGTINGYTRQGIARLNMDGTLDTSFGRAYLPSSPQVNKMALQPDGKILISDTVFPNPHRLNADGRDDDTFNPGTGVDGWVDAAIAVQPDGKSLIAGNFTSYNGTNINRIARLNGDAAPSTNMQFLASGQYFGMYLQGTVSNIYRIEYTSEVSTPSLWTPLFNVTLQSNPQFIVDTNPTAGQRFYRAVELPLQ